LITSVSAGSPERDPALCALLFRKQIWFLVPLTQGPRWETLLGQFFTASANKKSQLPRVIDFFN